MEYSFSGEGNFFAAPESHWAMRTACLVLAIAPLSASVIITGNGPAVNFTALPNGYTVQSIGGTSGLGTSATWDLTFPLALVPGSFERVDWENIQVDDMNNVAATATVWADNTALATARGGVSQSEYLDTKWFDTFVVPDAASYRLTITGWAGIRYFTLNTFTFALSDPPLPVPEPAYALPLALTGLWFFRSRPRFH